MRGNEETDIKASVKVCKPPTCALTNEEDIGYLYKI